MLLKRRGGGDYLGKTVQIVPHLTDALQEWVETVAKVPVSEGGEVPDVCVIELWVFCFFLFVYYYQGELADGMIGVEQWMILKIPRSLKR